MLTGLSESDALEFIRSQIADVTKGNPIFRDHYYRALDEYESGHNIYELPLFMRLNRYPVDVEEFLFGQDFLNRPRAEIYPAVLNDLLKINNPNGYRVTNPYTELVATGGIGSAKTTIALYTVAYQLYLLSCFSDPHTTFGMDSTSEIIFIFQSLSGSLAQDVDYTRFRAICDQSTYFRTVFPYNPRLKRELHFPNRIQVKAVGSDGGAIGQNVIGGLIDELNFMAITKKSSKTIDRGEYNQALTIYNGISRRRKTRFMSSGRMPGILCLVSSKRYPGEFTDKKLEEAKTDPTIYIYDKRVWDIKPEGTYNSGWIDIFTGDLTRKAHIIESEDDAVYSEPALIVKVPTEYRSDFEDDIIGALRDIAGVGTLARYPFLLNTAKVYRCFGKTKSIFSVEETEFKTGQLKIYLNNLRNLTLPRWVHIDLGVTNDSCGFAIGHVPNFKTINRAVGGGVEVEVLPVVRFDGLLRIVPPKGDEIQFYKVREILYILRAKGLNIKWVTFDSYQSTDSIQILQQKGFLAGLQSMDKTTDPYELTKVALYDDRVEAPEHNCCLTELLSLEKDNKTGKVDHPVSGSKDVSDAMAGVISGLSNRREIWTMYGVPLRSPITHPSNSQGESNGSITKQSIEESSI